MDSKVGGEWKWVRGTAISVKHKVGKRGPFVGIVMEELGTNSKFWFSRTPEEQEASPVHKNFPAEVYGVVTTYTEDMEMALMNDALVMDPKEESDRLEKRAEAHVERVQEKHAYIAKMRREREQAQEKAEHDGPAVKDGTYTVVFNNDPNDYETIRIETMKKGGLEGKTMVQYLAGPDNTFQYQGFAFLFGDRVCTWRKYQGSAAIARKAEAANVLVAMGTEAQRSAGEAYAMQSGSCFRCGRKLTVPASLNRGLGPECATKF